MQQRQSAQYHSSTTPMFNDAQSLCSNHRATLSHGPRGPMMKLLTNLTSNSASNYPSQVHPSHDCAIEVPPFPFTFSTHSALTQQAMEASMVDGTRSILQLGKLAASDRENAP